MNLIEVGQNKAHIKAFLNMVNPLYKGFPNWIRPLDKDIEAVFDPSKNKFFRHGECVRWILNNEKGETIGRVAAFIDRKTSKSNTQPTGGMGFFECINKQEVANILFNKCQDWLSEKGQEAMDGPINFGERDKFWGLHIEGDYPPAYGMFYHPPYYKTLFENFGFKIYFKQITYNRLVSEPLNEIIFEKAKRIFANKAYTFQHLKLNQLERFTAHFREIYNKAWVKHSGVKGMSEVQAKSIMLQLKPIFDEKIIWFAYYENQPIAFFIMIPGINKIFKHFNGKFGLWQKLRFLYYQKTRYTDSMLGLVFGVIPEFQGKGVEGALVVATAEIVQGRGSQYKEMEMNWIGDFNPKMMHVAESFGGKPVKIHATYRKLFDPNKPFERCPTIH